MVEIKKFTLKENLQIAHMARRRPIKLVVIILRNVNSVAGDTSDKPITSSIVRQPEKDKIAYCITEVFKASAEKPLSSDLSQANESSNIQQSLSIPW